MLNNTTHWAEDKSNDAVAPASARIVPGRSGKLLNLGDISSALLLALITFLVFCPVLKCQFVGFWDDEDKITANRDYHPPRLWKLTHYWVPPPHETFYVPVTYSIYGLLAMAAQRPLAAGIADLSPAVFHAANLLAHVASAVLVFLILRRLVRSRWAAWAGAALFALHPLQVEPAAWTGTFYTPLSGMFSLLAIWQYLLFSETPRANPGRRRTHYVVGTLAFALALLSKPSTIAVPLIVAAIELGLRGRRLRELAAPLGVWVLMCVPIVWINRLAFPGTSVYGPEPWQRAIVALDALAFYLWKLIVPFRLVPDYGRSPRWLLAHPVVWLTCLAPIAILVICRVYRRSIPWLGVAAAVFVAGLISTLGLLPFDFQRYSTVADRYVSLSLLGASIFVAFALDRRSSMTARFATLLILGALATLSFRQTAVWHDSWRLFADTIEVNPDSLAAAGAFRYLLVEHADDPQRTCTLASPELVRVGDLLMRQRHPELAGPAYTMALNRGTASADIYDRLALALVQTEKLTDAAAACRQALRLNPADPRARSLLEQIRSQSHLAEMR